MPSPADMPGHLPSILMPRGSREQVLHWTDQPRFLPELLGLAPPEVHCCVTANSQWMPMGLAHSREARLESFGPKVVPDYDWKSLGNWWLAKPKGANTPNWDIALGCDIGGKPGLILVEAKAHERELDERGKEEREDASPNSRENHRRIAEAISEAQRDLRARGCLEGITISHERAYQLANRIAFAWRLASTGIPVVLLYLGFIDDKEIANAGKPFESSAHWHHHVREHLGLTGDEMVSIECQTAKERFWLLSRARPAVSSDTPTAIG